MGDLKTPKVHLQIQKRIAIVTTVCRNTVIKCAEILQKKCSLFGRFEEQQKVHSEII